MRRVVVGFTALCALAATPLAAQALINWENPHVHPLDLTPDGSRLLAVNTPDNRLQVFDLTGGSPAPLAAIPVGLDPVSVRARSDREAWVVNHISDSVSVVDLATGHVVATLATADEPADVVFAGSPERAFVSCSQANQVLVFDPADLAAPPFVVAIEGEDPRAMAVSPAGDKVYVGIFESGNRTTILGGGVEDRDIDYPPQVVDDPSGPHGGTNPPPNSGDQFVPPMNPANPAPPRASMIVRRGEDGRWVDDNSGDWTDFVSGPRAAESGRPVGWDLADHDLAVIDAPTLAVSYARGLMNIVMAVAVNPASGQVAAVGTDATNEVRFEPVVSGTFLRVNLALVDPAGPTRQAVVDLNPHLDYSVPTVPQVERDRSIGDPRAIVFNASGSRGWVAGMGSNNLVAIDAAGGRAGAAPIPVGEGPTGLALDEARGRLYVLNKFGASVSTVALDTETEISRSAFFDPSPAAIKAGRRHLYSTHETSGLGHLACASCHVDARIDRLAWDLGDPAGDMKSNADQNLGRFNPLLLFGFEDFHPMKGPMLTQTLQDIIGKEPHHWRGDRDGIEEFAPAFIGLLGDDEEPTAGEMQEFEDFLATIHFPPNPFRNFDNSLPRDLPLPGHYSTGRFSPAGEPLPNGDAQRALDIYKFPNLIDAGVFSCSTCHTLPTGMGTNQELVGLLLREIPPGPKGEKHHALVSVDGLTNITMKVPQLRNLYERVGFETTQARNTAGFGFLHDGSIDSVARFVSEPLFLPESLQEVADLVALLMAFTGSDLPGGSPPPLDTFEPDGPPSQDTHAAVGKQTTVADGGAVPPGQQALIDQMIALADGAKVGLVARGRVQGAGHGFTYLGGGLFQSDISSLTLTQAQLLASARPGSELTYTVVPRGTQGRIGIDRDGDGAADGDEVAACSDPADAASLPGGRLDIEGGPIEAGAPHTFLTVCTLPGREVLFAASRDGLGVTDTPFGPLGIANAVTLGQATAGPDGRATLTRTVPGQLAGSPLWWQAIDESGEASDIETAVVE